MTPGSTISFYYNNVSFTLKNKKKLKQFVLFLFKNESQQIKEIRYIFCTDKELLRLNKVYLKHNYYTDVICFLFSADKKGLEAEIYISIDRVKKNSKIFGKTFKNEMHRVIFHGALHLCGYKDKTNRERTIMRKKEDAYLQKYFYFFP